MRIAKNTTILLVALFAAAAVVSAQTSTGEVNGSVTDNSGGAISGATVRLTNQGTNVTKESHTNANGYFVFINVLPGSYVLTVEKQGFKTAETFFYACYEGWRFSQPFNTFAMVPTPSELGMGPGLNGNLDFTGSLEGAISATAQTANQLYNPYSPGGNTPFQCVPGTGSGNPFSGSGYTPMTPEPINTTAGTSFGTQAAGAACNIIPAGLVNQQMVKLVQAYFQQPNFAPVYGVENNNYFDTRPHTDNMNSWQIRLDQNFGQHDTVFLRLSQMWVSDTEPNAGTISQNPQTYHAYNFGGRMNRRNAAGHEEIL